MASKKDIQDQILNILQLAKKIKAINLITRNDLQKMYLKVLDFEKEVGELRDFIVLYSESANKNNNESDSDSENEDESQS